MKITIKILRNLPSILIINLFLHIFLIRALNDYLQLCSKPKITHWLTYVLTYEVYY